MFDVSPRSGSPWLPGLTLTAQGHEPLEGGIGLRTISFSPSGPLQGLFVTSLVPVLHGVVAVPLERHEFLTVEVGMEGGWRPRVGALARINLGVRLTACKHAFLGVHPFNPSLVLLSGESGGLKWDFPTALELGVAF